MKTILTFDPGSRNCGYAVMAYSGPKKLGLEYHDPLKAKILECGLFFNTIQSMVSPHYQTDYIAFIKAAKEIINKYNPDVVYIERYQTRGFKGTTIEAVNAMIGILTCLMQERGKPTHAIIASQWKTQFKRINGKESLDKLYKQALTSFRCPPHVIDAILINLYGNSKKEAFRVIPKKSIRQAIESIDWKEVEKNLSKAYKERTKGR